jgi:hypothetical protein
LVFQNSLTDPKEHLSESVRITDNSFVSQTITCGQTITHNLDYCFGEARLKVVNNAPAFAMLGLSVAGTGQSGPAYSVGFNASGMISLQTATDNEGLIRLFLPQGTYTYQTTVNVSGGSFNQPPQSLSVIPGWIVETEPGAPDIFLGDPTSCASDPGPCTTANSVNLTATVTPLNPADSVTVSYTVNGGISVSVPYLASGSPFSFTIPLGPCANTIVITVADQTTGASTTITKIINKLGPPPVISGCQDIVINVPTYSVPIPVNYNVTAGGICPGVTLTCNPPAPGPFPLGTMLVTCTAVDACGQTTTCTFNVTVRTCATLGVGTFTCAGPGLFNYTVPVNNLSADTISKLEFWPVGSCFGFNPYSVPAVIPPSSSALVTTTLAIPTTCPSQLCFDVDLLDSNGDVLCTQRVCVDNPALPKITCPPDITVDCTSDAGATVNFGYPTMSSLCCTITSFSPSSLPGNFPIGVTPVTWTVEDSCGYVNHCTFNITVVGKAHAQTGRWVKADGIPTGLIPIGSRANAIAVDAGGNSFVAGRFAGKVNFGSTTLTAFGGEDIFLARYNTLGVLLWVRQAGGSSGDDEALGVAADSTGNCFVTGSFTGSADFSGISISGQSASKNIFVAKYDSQGNVGWALAGGGLGPDMGESVAVDNAGNCYVAGEFHSSAMFDTMAGSPISVWGFGSRDCFLAKYDPFGVLQWVTQSGASGSGSYLADARGLAVNPTGTRAWLTGLFTGSASGTPQFGAAQPLNPSSGDAFVAQCDISGSVPNWTWARQTFGLTSSADGRQIGVDASDNCYFTALFHGTTAIATDNQTVTTVAAIAPPSCNPSLNDYLVGSFDSLGVPRWLKSGSGCGDDETRGLAINPATGDVFVTGFLAGSGLAVEGGQRVVVFEYDHNNGDLKWTGPALGSSVNQINAGRAIAADRGGCVYVAGSFTDSSLNFQGFPNPILSLATGSREMFVGKYCPACADPPPNTTPQPEWTRQTDLPCNTNTVRAAEVDPAGNLWVAATIDGCNAAQGVYRNFDMKLIKYDACGGILVDYTFSGPMASPPLPAGLPDEVAGMKIDAFGNVFLAGSSRDSSGHFQWMVFKFDPTGFPLWQKSYFGGISTWNKACGILLDKAGNPLVAGLTSQGGKPRITLIKLNSSFGNILGPTPLSASAVPGTGEMLKNFWVPDGAGEPARRIMALSDSGEVAVTGRSGLQCIVAVFDPNTGCVNWNRPVLASGASSEFGVSIAMDTLAPVNPFRFYVASEEDSFTTPYKKWVIHKFGAAYCMVGEINGPSAWPIRYNSFSGSASDEPVAIAVETKTGNVVATGIQGAYPNRQTVTARWSQFGTAPIQDTFATAYPDSAPATLLLDSANQSYVTGTAHSTSPNERDYVTLRYPNTGPSPLPWWASWNFLDSASNYELDRAEVMALDRIGGTYVSGISTYAGVDSIDTIKYCQGPPLNENRIKAQPIVVGTTSFSSCEAKENLPHSSTCGADLADVWFVWRTVCAGEVYLDTYGSCYDTVLQVYDWVNGTLVPVDCNNDALPLTRPFGTVQSALKFSAQANHLYYIQVGGNGGATGEGRLTLIGPTVPLGTCLSSTTPCGPWRKIHISGNSTGVDGKWRITVPATDSSCCSMDYCGTVASPGSGQPAWKLAQALAASINNSPCGQNGSLRALWFNWLPFRDNVYIQVCGCATPFIFRVGDSSTDCDALCIVPNNPGIPNGTAIYTTPTMACHYNPTLMEEPIDSQDANGNGIADEIDIVTGASLDANNNGIPDEVEVGCANGGQALTIELQAGQNFLANPFDHPGGNTIGNVLPGVRNSASVSKWNGSAFLVNVYDPDLAEWQDPAMTLNPGEGFVVTVSTNLSLTLAGCPHPQQFRSLVTNGCQLVAGSSNAAAHFEDIFGQPPFECTTMQIYDGSNYVTFTYRNGNWSPNEPVLGSGQSAFVCYSPCPPPVWVLNTPVIGPDQMTIQWSGPEGGTLESAASLVGPWTTVSSQTNHSASLPSPLTNGIPMQFFRVRSN